MADSIDVTRHRLLTDSADDFARQQDTSKAIAYHKRALAHARLHKLPEHEARSLTRIAILLKGQDSSESLNYLDSAREIALRLNRADLLADIMKARSAVYKQQQNYGDALAALEAHQELLKTVFESNRRKEEARQRAVEQNKDDRLIFIMISTSLVLLFLVFALYHRKLSRLNRSLLKSNRIKDTLFSIIGHDLRGPAGNIMQALDVLGLDLLDDAEEKEVITLLKEQSWSFNETLNTLLNWATAQLKGAEPQVATVNAMSAIQRSLDLLRAQAIAKNIEISAPAGNPVAVLADIDQLDFVVRNLISNAIKFSYPGGRIQISAEKQDHNGLIAVHDDGKGIPAEKQAELFSEGQLNSTYGTKGEKGTGLGLMLSWDFIRANHGRIWCDSREGAGTTFYISLPLAM
ncbi:sensor histidine kinase [Mucilaginibacter conchicola]|uniref:histidine kinase n=1 Tax=Mucilaginibacter conchicola TaxID=2303333 RepID=A0A372NXN9_9SPHI|nr:sensor histidine kinase [Mucilaginibacter conchicola]